jgi:hypothetical protein
VAPEAILAKLPNVHDIQTRNVTRENKDDVFVAIFRDNGGGGLITFCKGDGSFVHTLNEPHGLERKLKGLGLQYLVDE